MFKFKKGDKVYCLDSFGYIDEGVIKKCENTVEASISGNQYFNVYTVDSSIGITEFLEENIFKTCGDAIKAKTDRTKTKIKEYESKINNLPQLFSFMLSQMYCEEYTDYEAIQASKNKIKEITGIDMDAN